MRRRRALLVLSAAVAALATAWGTRWWWGPRLRSRVAPDWSPVPPVPPGTDGAATTLLDAPLRTLTTLAEVLLPTVVGTQSAEFAARHYHRQLARRAGYHDQYEAAVRLLDDASRSHHGGRPFSDLTLTERTAVVSVLLPQHHGETRFERLRARWFVTPTIAAFRRFVVSDLLVAFYQSPAGWAVVGYSHYPGVPAADPRDYAQAVLLERSINR